MIQCNVKVIARGFPVDTVTYNPILIFSGSQDKEQGGRSRPTHNHYSVIGSHLNHTVVYTHTSMRLAALTSRQANVVRRHVAHASRSQRQNLRRVAVETRALFNFGSNNAQKNQGPTRADYDEQEVRALIFTHSVLTTFRKEREGGRGGGRERTTRSAERISPFSCLLSLLSRLLSLLSRVPE